MGTRAYLLAGALLVLAGIAATPPLYAGRFLTTAPVLPCAQAYVIREHVGWILQLSWEALAFLAGAVFASLAWLDSRRLWRHLRPPIYVRKMDERYARERKS